jgi:hypothetical protein|tara:strand:+ start:1110 stop:1718 length:609 start_codon:yes stop_codon:yes gene_type:complete
MAVKSVARPMDIPPGRMVGEDGTAMEDVMGPEPVDEMPEITPEEEGQVDMILGQILDFIWDTGYETIVKKLRDGQSNLPEAMGHIAGQMVNREVQAASKGGVEVSRDILIGIANEVINALAEVADHEGIMKTKSEDQQQKEQGEALIYAVQKYGELGDPGLDPQQPMQMAQNILRDKYPEERVARKMGMRVNEEEVPNGELA